ncbi:hypothetical protein FA15DRAFT_606979 [Coprinopsis marcescibilis]|uniref:CCHC-type domain-containing protein n=1 Tax=Coprinopsis marcescibilis TaxID=230819 RepID=A0A5C3K9P2_COPMA|nr:hypothetical protein FA15DRAFT_606979 [Coprinopsis marcescibilis]
MQRFSWQSLTDIPRAKHKRGRSDSPLPKRRASTRQRYNHSRLPVRHREQGRSYQGKPQCCKVTQSFWSGAAEQKAALSACIVCLGRHPHNIRACNSKMLWDGSPAQVRKNDKGCLTTAAGNILCTDWQRVGSCSNTLHNSKHECSGCGDMAHRAQRCPRVQKA